MLFATRQQGLLHLCLIGMDVAWFTPFVLLIFDRDGRLGGPAAVYGGLLAVLLLWLLALEVLNRFYPAPPRYELTVLALIVVSSLLLVRLWLYAGAGLSDAGWLGQTFNAVFNFHRGLRPELGLILVNLFLWQRATNATSRELSFFRVGLSFRIGILLLLVGATWLNRRTGQSVMVLLWLYFGLGLLAVALARLGEKASDAPGGAGQLLTSRRLAQLGLAVGLTVGSAGAISLLYTPERLRVILAWLGPVWRLLGTLFVLLVRAIFWVLEPALIWLQQRLQALFQDMDFSFLDRLTEALSGNENVEEVTQGERLVESVPPWIWTSLRYVGVFLAILVLLGLVLLFLDRVRPRAVRTDAEIEGGEAVTFGGGLLGEGLRRWRGLARLVRRYGVRRGLLAAISMENIYANLCRLARQRGHPRRPSQPPDDYLPVLVRAFGGHEEALARLTNAYMQVHYGDQPLSWSDLARLRADYQRIQAEPPPVTPER